MVLSAKALALVTRVNIEQGAVPEWDPTGESTKCVCVVHGL